MPTINWNALPYALKQHLALRMEQRKISVADLEALRKWIKSGPDLPDGEWFVDFGSFKLAGRGNQPLTFLEKGMAAKGIRIEWKNR